MKTITGHFEWEKDQRNWLPVDTKRDADNRVLAVLAPDRTGISVWLPLENLLPALPEAYRGRISGNGTNMFNRGRGLGKDFIFEKESHGRIVAVRSIGLVAQIERAQLIRPDIHKIVRGRPCAVLNTHQQIEVDHKAGRKNERRMEDLAGQEIEDFQALHATVNAVKRTHCQRCLQSRSRYDARAQGYSVGWWVGDARSQTCNGCYWHDPALFNAQVSKEFEPK